MIVAPLPFEAPVIPPVTGPAFHKKVLPIAVERLMFGPVPLQVAATVEVVNAGSGFTVIVIAVGGPEQPAGVDVAITLYTTVPATALLGLVRIWLMLAPPPIEAPVTPPVIVPIVHAKLLGTDELRITPGFTPLQVVGVAGVTAGAGFTVIVIGVTNPTQLPVVDVGVTL